MKTAPFYRSKQIALAVMAAMTLPDIAARMVALGQVAPYRSRGKGRGAPSRVYGNPPGKYMPHQGPRECMRRRLGGMAAVRRAGGVELELDV